MKVTDNTDFILNMNIYCYFVLAVMITFMYSFLNAQSDPTSEYLSSAFTVVVL